MQDIKHDNEMNTYKTKDLAEATALSVGGQRVVDIDRRGSVCWFVFEDRARCVSMSNDYFFGDLEVNAREFAETFRRLKIKINTET